MTDPVRITFEVSEGDVWRDPEGVFWTVKTLLAGGARLERTVVKHVGYFELVKTWRNAEDDGPVGDRV